MQRQRIAPPRAGAAFMIQQVSARRFPRGLPLRLIQPNPESRSMQRAQDLIKSQPQEGTSKAARWSQLNARQDDTPIRHARQNCARKLSESTRHQEGNRYEKSGR